MISEYAYILLEGWRTQVFSGTTQRKVLTPLGADSPPISHFAGLITTIASWLFPRRGKKMRAFAFWGESQSQLSGVFVQFGDPFHRHLRKAFSACPLPETQKTSKKR